MRRNPVSGGMPLIVFCRRAVRCPVLGGLLEIVFSLGYLAEVRGPRVEERPRDRLAQGHEDGGAGVIRSVATLALSTNGKSCH